MDEALGAEALAAAAEAKVQEPKAAGADVDEEAEAAARQQGAAGRKVDSYRWGRMRWQTASWPQRRGPEHGGPWRLTPQSADLARRTSSTPRCCEVPSAQYLIQKGQSKDGKLFAVGEYVPGWLGAAECGREHVIWLTLSTHWTVER